MSRTSRWVLLAVAACAGAAALLLLVSPREGQESGAAPGASAGGAETAWWSAHRRGAARPVLAVTEADATPGALAFRAYTDDYVRDNAQLVAAHMQEHGLTLEETEELTYFAMVSLESLDWDVVEDLTGLPMQAEARRQAWSAMRRRSQQMRDELGAHVRAGDDVETRRVTITRIENAYLEEYFLLTGMTSVLLDQLLLRSVDSQDIWEESSAVASNAAPGPPAGRGPVTCVQRDPARPEAAPIPVACP